MEDQETNRNVTAIGLILLCLVLVVAYGVVPLISGDLLKPAPSGY